MAVVVIVVFAAETVSVAAVVSGSAVWVHHVWSAHRDRLLQFSSASLAFLALRVMPYAAVPLHPSARQALSGNTWHCFFHLSHLLMFKKTESQCAFLMQRPRCSVSSARSHLSKSVGRSNARALSAALETFAHTAADADEPLGGARCNFRSSYCNARLNRMFAGGGFFLGTLGYLGTPLRERFVGTSSRSMAVSSIPSVISLSVPVSSLSLPRFEVHTS